MSAGAATIHTEDIPGELRDCPQWVVWLYEQRDGKATKVPYVPKVKTRTRASSTDPASWDSYGVALTACEAGGYSGVGFVLAEGDPYVGIDLDHCINETGDIEGWANEIVRTLSSYTEVTPSGRGLRIIAKGKLPNGSDGNKDGPVEMYSAKRFLTITGQHLEGTPLTIEDRAEQVAEMHARYFSQRESPAPAPAPKPVSANGHTPSLSDSDILRLAEKASNGPKFRALWSGDTSAYRSASEADAALCGLLAFYAGDEAQLDRLFRQSALYRPKWDRADYRRRTLSRAMSGTEHYKPPTQRIASRNGHSDHSDHNGHNLPSEQGENVSAQLKDIVWAETNGAVEAIPKLHFSTARQIAAATPSEVAWAVKPWSAYGSITETTAKVKTGKTTLIAEMVAAKLEGEHFLGQPTTPGAVVWLTEQQPTSFREVLRRANLLERDDLLVLPWHETMGIPWPIVVSAAIAEAKRIGANMLVVDTLPQFAGLRGDDENSAGAALAAVEPLQEAAAEGLAVLIVRHDRKAPGAVGDSARGSSAFGGAVDIILSLRRSEGNSTSNPNVRVIHSLSRFDQTPAELVIELTDEGYIALGTQGAVAEYKARAAILDVLPTSEQSAKTLDELLALPGLTRSTIQRVVGELVASNELRATGAGKKGDPYRYWRVGGE